jgi:hypothetical protein
MSLSSWTPIKDKGYVNSCPVLHGGHEEYDKDSLNFNDMLS